MADPLKETEPSRTPHGMRWDEDDWDGIMRVAAILSAREHDDVTPTSVIRRATRRFVAEVLDGAGG
jgi:hypothetical protein